MFAARDRPPPPLHAPDQKKTNRRGGRDCPSAIQDDFPLLLLPFFYISKLAASTTFRNTRLDRGGGRESGKSVSCHFGAELHFFDD